MSLAGELRIPSEVADRRAGCVLIVDDEPALRRFAARVLSEEGYSILEAADGLEAIQQIDANRSSIDVVVSDIVMPRVTGTELLQQLARRHPTLPVVLMSGYAAAVLLERGIAAPCAVLAKPFTPEQLVDEVRRCLPARG